MATETQLVGSTADLFGAAEARAAQEGRKVSNDLGKDAFLKLLVAQLKAQDPMKPMADTAFVAEMAQFTSLEQMQNLNKLMESQVSFGNLTQASGLIDKHVVVLDQATGTNVTGQVDEVRMVEGKAQIIVNGKAYPTTDVLQVATAPFTANGGTGSSTGTGGTSGTGSSTGTSGTGSSTGTSTSTGTGGTSDTGSSTAGAGTTEPQAA